MASGLIVLVSRRRAWGIAAAVVVAAAVAGWRLGWWPGTAGATAIYIYDPAGFTADERLQGSCWTGSLAAPREGAFRCASGNAIFDPCFAMDGAVACPRGNPAENRGVLLELTEPLPQPPDAWTNPPDPAHPSPWFVRLAGGGECGVLTGTRPPEYPLGCTLPDRPQGVSCSMPAPLAGNPRLYASLCGVWNPSEQRLEGPEVHPVAEMWL
ncbi:hypothetical protein [Limnochorda pilosa]|uniref:Uncharacterized protein n=1 Tax=Limnochorda pilosa TaxID=1555112 RepID=A0A0K2SNK9_LIMPI|nr:hypothetical protein [Limnochorda pilosa]BAS28690.1 hypothetical protein LIP_2861 [Limnochorda pilosa]